MVEYTVICERSEDEGWGAYAQDLPGLGVVGNSLEEAQQLIKEGIEIHISSLKEFGYPVPAPTTLAARVMVAA